MDKTYLNNDLQKLREDFENGNVKVEDMDRNNLILLKFMYQLENITLDYQIEKQKETLNDYKTRLKNAIEYLKAKKGYNN